MSEWLDRKKKIVSLIAEYTPFDDKSILVSKNKSGWINIRIPFWGAATEHYMSLIEGLLLGSCLVASYYSDSGPNDHASVKAHIKVYLP